MADSWLDKAYDRGVHVRSHSLTGMKVYHFPSQPGVFYSAFGTEVNPELAREAGYDVDRLLKEKAKRDRLAEAGKLIEQEFDGQPAFEVVKEKHGFKAVHIGLGKHNVLDPDGNKLNLARPLSEDEAKKLLEKIARPASKKAPVAEQEREAAEE